MTINVPNGCSFIVSRVEGYHATEFIVSIILSCNKISINHRHVLALPPFFCSFKAAIRCFLSSFLLCISAAFSSFDIGVLGVEEREGGDLAISPVLPQSSEALPQSSDGTDFGICRVDEVGRRGGEDVD
jgi:hypothetical protein